MHSTGGCATSRQVSIIQARAFSAVRSTTRSSEMSLGVRVVIISSLLVAYALFLLTCRLFHLSVCVSVCVSVRKVYCGKTAEWIRMPFGVVSGVGRGWR